MASLQVPLLAALLLLAVALQTTEAGELGRGRAPCRSQAQTLGCLPQILGGTY